jgi:hypothetical protein
MTTTQQVTDEALLKLEAPSNAIKVESEKNIHSAPSWFSNQLIKYLLPLVKP